MRKNSMLAAAAGLAIILANAAQAAEVTLMSSGGMKVMLIDLATAFEGATKHKVTATYGAPGAIRGRIMAGEPMTCSCFPPPASTTS